MKQPYKKPIIPPPKYCNFEFHNKRCTRMISSWNHSGLCHHHSRLMATKQVEQAKSILSASRTRIPSGVRGAKSILSASRTRIPSGVRGAKLKLLSVGINPKNKYACPTCQEKFRWKASLLLHVPIHREDKLIKRENYQ